MSTDIYELLDEGPFDLEEALTRNRERLEHRFEEARLAGSNWLVECRNPGDAFDPEAGVYFVECLDDSAVDRLAGHCGPDNMHGHLVGVFDLRRPLDEQGQGLARDEWLARRPRHALADFRALDEIGQ